MLTSVQSGNRSTAHRQAPWGDRNDWHQHGDDGEARGGQVKVDVVAHQVRPVALYFAEQLLKTSLFDGLPPVKCDLLRSFAHQAQREPEISLEGLLLDRQAGQAVTGKVGRRRPQTPQKIASQNR